MKMNPLDAIGYVDDRLVEKADQYTAAKNKHTWVRWGAMAACLCLVVGGALAIFSITNNGNVQNDKNMIAGVGVREEKISAGDMPEGIDPIVASVAVRPAERSLADVADATLNEISESEARALELGQHFPTVIPEGYHFKMASIYETTMKDGTKYHLLRLHFTTGDKDHADMSVHAAEFSVQLTDFKPDTEDIYTIDTLPNVYVGWNAGDLTNDEIASVLHSIR